MNDKKEVTHLEDWRENMAAIAQWCRENNVGFLLNKSQVARFTGSDRATVRRRYRFSASGMITQTQLAKQIAELTQYREAYR